MSVRQAKEEIDSAEYTEWLAYYALDPFGEERHEFRNAYQMSLMANLWGGGSKKFSIEDFILEFDSDGKHEAQAKLAV